MNRSDNLVPHAIESDSSLLFLGFVGCMAWLPHTELMKLFRTSVPKFNPRIQNVPEEVELASNATIKDSLSVRFHLATAEIIASFAIIRNCTTVARPATVQPIYGTLPATAQSATACANCHGQAPLGGSSRFAQ